MKMASKYQNQHKNGAEPTSETENMKVQPSITTIKILCKYLHTYLKHVAILDLATNYCRWHHTPITTLEVVLFSGGILWLFKRANHITSENNTKTVSNPYEPYTLDYTLDHVYVPIKSESNYHHFWDTCIATIDGTKIIKIVKKGTQKQ